MDRETDARSIARKWWADHLEGNDVVDVKKSARLAEDMLRRDPDFMAGFVDAFLRQAMYEMGLKVLANQRAELRTREGVLRQLEKDEASIEWSQWREWDPTTGEHVALTAMNRDQLEASAAYRRKKAAELEADAFWLETLATYVGNNQRLGDVMSNAHITYVRKSTVPLRRT